MMNEPTLTDAERETLAEALAAHHPTRGMSVSMGVTCECGYWTGSEPESGKRPLPWGRDSLDLHRADIVAARVVEAVDRERAAWASKIEALANEMKDWPDADGDGYPVRAHEVRGDVIDCLRGLLADDDTEGKAPRIDTIKYRGKA